ncbi:MAG: glycoside hydrolase family 130 protein [Desulfuromusa sp.]|nr:glycoside hydrolase family 130 protein [Desulfuromusa sp.]
MYKSPLDVRRKAVQFHSEPSRVIAKSYLPGGEARIKHIIKRILALPEDQTNQLLADLNADFSMRHKNIEQIFRNNFAVIKQWIPEKTIFSVEKQCLLGAYFTHEYSIEGAAFFNPSIVSHPDQSHLKAGCLRFILSFRSTGEGHISSIEFRSGVIDENNELSFDPVSKLVETPELIENPTYDKYVFSLKIEDMEAKHTISEEILQPLPDQFKLSDLQRSIQQELDKYPDPTPLLHETIEKIYWLARSNYELKFRSDHRISERVIFPVSENESRGIEDARFVKFVEDDGSINYYATYTAYNGFNILPQLLETKDFFHFKIRTLNGKAVQNKGMALFPRRVDGKYMMISRQDGENMYIMASDNLHFWHQAELLQVPKYPWEFIQIGNCGSPLETEAGWILLTHGVGAMRRYCIGAYLLDLEDPTKVIGQLPEPLLSPMENEREGYVPNVLYTCGAIIHNDEVIIPYSMSDAASGIAVVSLKQLLVRLQAQAAA